MEEKHNEENKTQLIKNLCYEMDTNKLMINDNQNNHYLCDIYGRKKIKFLPNITGSLNRYKRQNIINDKKNLSYFQSTNYFSPNNNLSKNNNLSSFKSKTNKRQIDYHPTIRRFEGYSKFPRPIGPPLLNIPNYDIKEKDKRKIIDKLNYYFEDFDTKMDITRKNENIGVSYLTSDLNDFDLIKHDTEQSLKLIENTLNNFRDEYKLKLNIMHKDPNVKALNQFKKNLLLNKDSTIINGRILAPPNEKIKKNYKIINSIVHKAGLSLDRKNEKNNIFNKIKYNRKNKTISKFDNNYNYTNLKNISIESGHDRFNDFYKSKDFTVGRLINMDFGLTASDKANKTSTINANNESNKLPQISRNENIISRNEEENKIGGMDDAYKETEETLNNNISSFKSSIINNEKVKEKTLEEKINDNELSFISYMSENEKKYEKENIKNIKSIRNINKKVEHTNELLKGYQEKERKPPVIYLKSRILKLKSDGDLYRENLKLLRLTNSEAFKIQEQKDLYDLKMLEKKIKISTINANNVMKGKIFKSEKNKETNN